MSSPISRRTVLHAGVRTTGALTVLGLTACTDDAPPAPPDPDRVALEAALGVEISLLEAVSAWVDGGVRALEAERIVDHHVQALEVALGTIPSPSPTDASSAPSTEPEQSTAAVQRLLDAAVDSHARALRTASAMVSPLLASLAASDAALAASVRRAR